MKTWLGETLATQPDPNSTGSKATSQHNSPKVPQTYSAFCCLHVFVWCPTSSTDRPGSQSGPWVGRVLGRPPAQRQQYMPLPAVSRCAFLVGARNSISWNLSYGHNRTKMLVQDDFSSYQSSFWRIFGDRKKTKSPLRRKWVLSYMSFKFC